MINFVNCTPRENNNFAVNLSLYLMKKFAHWYEFFGIGNELVCV